MRALSLSAIALSACTAAPAPRFDPTRDRVDISARAPAEVAPAFVFSSKVMSLDDALRLALEHNPRLKTYGSAIDIASSRVIQARLWPNPSFNLGSEDGAIDGEPGINSGKITAGVTQTLPLTGIIDARTKAAQASRSVALLSYEVQVRQLMGSVRRSFYAVLLAQRFVEISETNLALARQLQQRANERVDSGAASETEKFRAEIEVAESEVALRGAETALQTARQDLLVLIANPDLKVESFTGAVPERFQQLDVARLERRIIDTHPLIARTEAAVEAAEAGLSVAEKSWLPQPQVGVALGRLREDDVDTVFEWSVSVPIPFFNRNQGTIAASQAQIRQAQQAARAARNRLLGRFRNALIRYRQQRQQVRDYKGRILPLSERSLALVRQQQSLGKLSQIDVLDAQRTVFRAKRTYLNLLQTLVSTQIDLEQLSGKSIESFAE